MLAGLGSRSPRKLALARRALRRLTFSLAAVVLVLGVLHAGARYVYCPSMAALLDAPCCAHADEEHAASDAPALSPDDSGCCRSLSLGPLPVASASSPPCVPVTPLVALVPSAAARGVFETRARPRPLSRESVGPPRSRAPARAALMVFLI